MKAFLDDKYNHDDIALLKTIGVNAIVYGVDTGVISNAVSTLDLKWKSI